MSTIPQSIANGSEPFYVLVISDDSSGKADGLPIVWETVIPAGSTLDAVKHQRNVVGTRYGPTFIAQCRIVPDVES